jgi:phage terminase small subunit
LFCHEYVALIFNGRRAYQRAYPDCKNGRTASTHAARLLRLSEIQARIAELTRPTLTKLNITAERVLQEIAFVAFQRASHLLRRDGTLKDPQEWDEATAATVAAIEPVTSGQQAVGRKKTSDTARPTLKVKHWDKVKALELLMRHLGLLKEDAPHPDRPTIDLTKLTDAQKRTLLAGLRLVLDTPAAGALALPAPRT